METSEVLLRQMDKVYASTTNIGETIQRALEADVTQLLDIPGEAHEQVDRVKAGGRYFEDLAESIGADSSVNEVRVAGMCRANDGNPKLLDPTMRLQPMSDCNWWRHRNYGRSA